MSFTFQESFNNVTEWLDHIEQHATEDVVIFLVGNRSDLTLDRVVDYTTAKVINIRWKNVLTSYCILLLIPSIHTVLL